MTTTQCGCKPWAAGNQCGVSFCKLHTRAPEMLSALRWYVLAMESDHIKGHTGTDCLHCRTRAILKDLED